MIKILFAANQNLFLRIVAGFAILCGLGLSQNSAASFVWVGCTFDQTSIGQLVALRDSMVNFHPVGVAAILVQPDELHATVKIIYGQHVRDLTLEQKNYYNSRIRKLVHDGIHIDLGIKGVTIFPTFDEFDSKPRKELEIVALIEDECGYLQEIADRINIGMAPGVFHITLAKLRKMNGTVFTHQEYEYIKKTLFPAFCHENPSAINVAKQQTFTANRLFCPFDRLNQILPQ